MLYRIFAYNGYLKAPRSLHAQVDFEASTSREAALMFLATNPFDGVYGPSGLRIRAMSARDNAGMWSCVNEAEYGAHAGVVR